MGNKNIQYLEKVADFIVDDSNFAVGHILMLNTPFYTYSWEHFLRNQKTPVIYFLEYIENTYGISLHTEAKYVWDSYVRKIKEKRYSLNNPTITESVDNRVMGNPHDILKFEGVSEELREKLIRIVERTVDGILKSITYEPLGDRNDMYVIKINSFKLPYGLYLENDGSEESFRKFCITYLDYILKEMVDTFKDFWNENPMLISSFGLGSTVLLMNKMGEIFIHE